MFLKKVVIPDIYFLGGEEAFCGSVCAVISRWMDPGRDEDEDQGRERNESNIIKFLCIYCSDAHISV